MRFSSSSRHQAGNEQFKDLAVQLGLGDLQDLFERMGFVATHTHPTRDVTRFKQGRINLLLNRDVGGQAAAFRAEHGPSANGMAFRVQDAKRAFDAAIARGAQPADASAGAICWARSASTRACRRRASVSSPSAAARSAA